MANKTKNAIEVRVDLLNIKEVQDAYDDIRESLFNRVIKNGATKGARRTVPSAKSELSNHRRTGQLARSVSYKYAGYPQGWTVMVGPRKYFRGSAPSWMSAKATTIDPVKYAHLVEGGRKAVSRPLGKPMPIFVKTLDQRRSRSRMVRPGQPKMPGYQGYRFLPSTMIQFGRVDKGKQVTQDRARRVPGGWLIFSQNAKEAPDYRWLGHCQGNFGQNIKTEVVNEVVNRLPSLVAQARARGRNPYKTP